MSKLQKCRAALESDLDIVADWVKRYKLAVKPSGKQVAFTSLHHEWCYEFALLRSFVSLETFMEQSFGLYAIGESVPGRTKPKKLLKIQASLPKVLVVLRGDKDFVGWNSPAAVIKRADTWFELGEPFRTGLGAGTSMLNYLRTARNYVAHSSDSAREEFLGKTTKLDGSAPRTLSVGQRMQSPPPAALATFSKPTLFEEAIEVMKGVAANIA